MEGRGKVVVRKTEEAVTRLWLLDGRERLSISDLASSCVGGEL